MNSNSSQWNNSVEDTIKCQQYNRLINNIKCCSSRENNTRQSDVYYTGRDLDRKAWLVI